MGCRKFCKTRKIKKSLDLLAQLSAVDSAENLKHGGQAGGGVVQYLGQQNRSPEAEKGRVVGTLHAFSFDRCTKDGF